MRCGGRAPHLGTFGLSRAGVRFVNLELSGRAAVVTGGTSGIGLSAVRRLLDEGMSVAFCARDKTRVDAVTQELARQRR